MPRFTENRGKEIVRELKARTLKGRARAFFGKWFSGFVLGFSVTAALVAGFCGAGDIIQLAV